MRRLIPPLLALLSCATEEPARRVPTYDYGGFRDPIPIEQAQPVVPPAGKPEEPAPKPDPCPGLCEAFDDANRECGSLSASCSRLANTDNDICRAKTKACKEADDAQRKLGACSCN